MRRIVGESKEHHSKVSSIDNENSENDINSTSALDQHLIANKQLTAILTEKESANIIKTKNKNPNIDLLNTTYDEGQTALVVDHLAELNEAIIEFKECHPTYDMPYFYFKPSNPVRIICKRIIYSNYFRIFMSIALLMSVVTLAWDNPLSRLSKLKSVIMTEYGSPRNLTFSQTLDRLPDPNVYLFFCWIKVLAYIHYYKIRISFY